MASSAPHSSAPSPAEKHRPGGSREHALRGGNALRPSSSPASFLARPPSARRAAPPQPWPPSSPRGPRRRRRTRRKETPRRRRRWWRSSRRRARAAARPAPARRAASSCSSCRSGPSCRWARAWAPRARPARAPGTSLRMLEFLNASREAASGKRAARLALGVPERADRARASTGASRPRSTSRSPSTAASWHASLALSGPRERPKQHTRDAEVRRAARHRLAVSVTRPVPASTAPRRSSRARAAAICPAGGGSSHGSAAAGSASAAPPPTPRGSARAARGPRWRSREACPRRARRAWFRTTGGNTRRAPRAPRARVGRRSPPRRASRPGGSCPSRRRSAAFCGARCPPPGARRGWSARTRRWAC